MLADEMALGKTMQAILAMRVLFRRGELRQALVVAPASVGATWERELMLWAPELTAERVQGPPGRAMHRLIWVWDLSEAAFLTTGPNILWLGIDSLDNLELPMPLSRRGI